MIETAGEDKLTITPMLVQSLMLVACVTCELLAMSTATVYCTVHTVNRVKRTIQYSILHYVAKGYFIVSFSRTALVA
jgi:hypothetical protein